MQVLENLKQVQTRIRAAARRVGREPGEIQLVAVTKTVPPEIINEVVAGGVKKLGENRTQELFKKRDCLPADVEWHLIGHLQTNKVNKIIGKVALIHSLDSWRLAEALSQASLQNGIITKVLVQINVAGEETKYGLKPAEAQDFVVSAARLPGLDVRGLMTIAPWTAQPEEVRSVFRQLRDIAIQLKNNNAGAVMEHLSMGMSGDFEVAVEEGANILRVGTAIFGQRQT